jgi:hypothetical protein
MDIQDLGAIGEFVSSLVIVVTLMVLIYETRGAKQATLEANAQERQRARNDMLKSLVETPDLADVLTTANQHLGLSREDVATQFGLAPEQYLRMSAYYNRSLLQLRDAYFSDLPKLEQDALNSQIRGLFAQPAFTKWYDAHQSNAPSGGSYRQFLRQVDELKPTR